MSQPCARGLKGITHISGQLTRFPFFHVRLFYACKLGLICPHTHTSFFIPSLIFQFILLFLFSYRPVSQSFLPPQFRPSSLSNSGHRACICQAIVPVPRKISLFLWNAFLQPLEASWTSGALLKIILFRVPPRRFWCMWARKICWDSMRTGRWTSRCGTNKKTQDEVQELSLSPWASGASFDYNRVKVLYHSRRFEHPPPQWQLFFFLNRVESPVFRMWTIGWRTEYRQMVTSNREPNMQVWHSNLAMTWQQYGEGCKMRLQSCWLLIQVLKARVMCLRLWIKAGIGHFFFSY